MKIIFIKNYCFKNFPLNFEKKSQNKLYKNFLFDFEK